MSFYKRYELVRLIQEGEAKTFSAVEIASGRPLLLHMLTASATLPATSVREIVARSEHHPQVIEVGEFAGSYYIAAEASDGFVSFRQWLDAPPAAPAVKPVEPPPPRKPPEIRKLNVKPSPPEPPMGEFTELFGVPKAKIAGKPEPGEFTKMFYGKVPVKPSGKPELPEMPFDVTGGSGEFTQFFGGQTPGKSPSQEQECATDEFKPVFDIPLGEPEDAPPVRAVNPGPLWQDAIQQPAHDDHTGEYTKFFGNSLPSEPVDIQAEQAKQAQLVEPKEKPFRQASDFTRMFGPGANSSPPPPPVSNFTPNSDSKSVSMIFGPSRSLGGAPAKTPEPANIFNAAPADADDYARVIGAGENPSQMGAFAASPMGPPPGKDKKHTTLIVILVLVGVILLSLLLWAIFARSK